MTRERLPALDRSPIPGCATSDPRPLVLDLGAVIAVGFGDAFVSRDGERVWSEPPDPCADLWTLRDAEDAARADPDHDWRVVLRGPLSNAIYQRREDGQWVLVEAGEGFA